MGVVSNLEERTGALQTSTHSTKMRDLARPLLLSEVSCQARTQIGDIGTSAVPRNVRPLQWPSATVLISGNPAHVLVVSAVMQGTGEKDIVLSNIPTRMRIPSTVGELEGLAVGQKPLL